jgi:glycosyltransferase involved in cell wall biosynthesis
MLPVKLRYSEWFVYEIKKQLNSFFDEIVVLGEKIITGKNFNTSVEMFSPINEAIIFELNQIDEFLNLKIDKNKDVLLSLDISFPGFLSNVLYHRPMEAYGYCHATSKNKYDYFSPVRYSKFQCETSHSKLFKKVFVGSEYHKNKLGWDNVKVIGLPIPPFQIYREEKKYDIISVCRPNNQKITKEIEDVVEKDFGKIVRQECNTWEQYYKFLSEGKILLISSKEDTFNYSIMEAIMNGTVVLAPTKCAFPELLERDYLYSDYNELKTKIELVLNSKLLPPVELKNQDLVNNFYENLIKEMK